MILFIDTALRDASLIILKDGEDEYIRKLTSVNVHQPDALREIDRVFKKAQSNPKRLTGIAVVVGPGQFSSLRTGIAIANAFGYALRIPVVGIAKEDAGTRSEFIAAGRSKLRRKKTFFPIMPEYGKEPNITSPKK
ncbi:tRNA (adenosine(37)-N6)-threonylcarbamoyltransferase complex dimerization subunit type 1 TsaB [Candidatus Uhrbacteria bacterium]|nr:tRNA (adenosine(37)-N6)-threonylcarbamoyltransferase complex dimerization subunit type 1 TsaB [Candidatus Uhrbacteria bacterium]